MPTDWGASCAPAAATMPLAAAAAAVTHAAAMTFLFMARTLCAGGDRQNGRKDDLQVVLEDDATSMARRTSATRSRSSSRPALIRMKPSDTASVPHRARRSAVVWTPPKLVASATSDAAV